jgi:hypothetical protein
MDAHAKVSNHLRPNNDMIFRTAVKIDRNFGLIWRRLLHMINHEDVNGYALRIKPQSELLL